MRTLQRFTNRATSRGFTIVELLIVIVVIAILAAITTVTFNGIQQRANDTKQVDAAAKYVRLITLYKTQNGTYPAGVSCVGNNNVDTNSDGRKDCGDNGNITVDQTVLNRIATSGSLPDVTTKQYTGADGVKRGGMFWNGDEMRLTFFLGGSQSTCPAVGIPSIGGSTGNGSRYCQVFFPTN